MGVARTDLPASPAPLPVERCPQLPVFTRVPRASPAGALPGAAGVRTPAAGATCRELGVIPDL